MATYTLNPNERDICLYLTPESLQEFDRIHPDYRPEPLTIDLDWAPFENEAQFVENFKSLLDKYGLLKHYDNLLYIVFTTFDDQWAKIQHAYNDYDSKKRARELAQLLLLLYDTPKGKLGTIAFKALTADVKVSDAILTDWISKTLTKAVIDKDYPIGRFGDAVNAMLPHQKPFHEPESIDYDQLREMLKTRLVNPRNLIKRGQFNLCMSVYIYLQHGTRLKAEPGVSFSDAQLNFLFDLLELLKQVSRERITSDPKDYMRTLLVNFMSR